MTVLFVGDIHLKSARVLPAVDRAVAMTGTDGVVFLGDVCDDWDVTAREAVAAVRMFADWVAARRAAGLDVIVLAGNHDLPVRGPVPRIARVRRMAGLAPHSVTAGTHGLLRSFPSVSATSAPTRRHGCPAGWRSGSRRPSP